VGVFNFFNFALENHKTLNVLYLKVSLCIGYPRVARRSGWQVQARPKASNPLWLMR
jgi:hypothetical protein